MPVASYGVATSTKDQPVSDFLKDADTLLTTFTSENGGTNGVLIRDIFSRDAQDNDVRGKTVIYGAAYVTFTDGSGVIGGQIAGRSLYQIITFLEETSNTKWQTQREAFCTAWADVLACWGIEI